MNYREFLRSAAHGGSLARVKVEPGVTDGFSRYDADAAHDAGRAAASGHRAPQGTDYALHYRLTHDKAEVEEVNEMEEVEGISSITGTLPNPDDVDSEHLTQVYQRYLFDNPPTTDTTPQLIIHDYKDDILENIESSSVVVIKGHTGCGKTTQVPQMILDNAREDNVHCNIVVTQPRRIATLAVARTVARQRNWSLGTIVGYQVALEKKVSTDTRLLYCTTGVLLEQLVAEKSLSRFTHIIVDEVHERDMETDFLLILIKKYLQSSASRTKIILMSATVDTEKFSDYFTRRIRNASGRVHSIEPPLIQMPSDSHNFPVSVFYLDDLENAKFPKKMPEVRAEEPRISQCMMELAASLVEVFEGIDAKESGGSFIGSILMFLPGMPEIERMFDCLHTHKARCERSGEEWVVRPLHSNITFEEQAAVLRPPPPNCRKIILATNIAESSITVPDVKYVLDFCLMKYVKQEVGSGLSCLETGWMSKSQGEQRAGRVGRVMAGRVYRLVPRHLYQSLEEDCEPEMLRSPLEVLVLKSKKLAEDAPPAKLLAFALDPPDLSNIQRTVLNLKLAGGLSTLVKGEYVEGDGELTFVGKVMASLPLDIALTKLILMGHSMSLLSDAIVIACAMSVRSIFSSPFKQQLEAYNSKIAWADFSCSDPIACKIAYEVWRKKTSMGFFNRSGGLTERDLASRYFVQIKSLKEVSRLEEEVTKRLRNLDIVEPAQPAVRWTDLEKSLVLKMMIAGAFYPNYFVRKGVDEKEAVRMVGGRDPFSTCYLSGFPLDQPGPLYSHTVSNYFSHCGSDIHVSFDGSTKVYVEFKSSVSDLDSAERPASMPGHISMALYRAVKLRHLNKIISVPLLPRDEARRRWAEIAKKRKDSDGQDEIVLKAEEATERGTNLPGPGTEMLPVDISYRKNVSRFWVQIADDANRARLGRLFHLLNARPSSLAPVQRKLRTGDLVAAPFSDSCGSASSSSYYYRARIVNLGVGNSVQVYFIDYGNTEWMDAGCVKDFDESLVQLNVTRDPDLAIECTLTEIQPSVMSNRNGLWSDAADKEFERYFGRSADPTAIAKVYSVVNGVVSVVLFRNARSERGEVSLETEDSFNRHLVRRGLADPCEEPYLSRENHIFRLTARKRPDLASASILQSARSALPAHHPPPLPHECVDHVVLKGPRSALEMQLYCMTQKSLCKRVNVDPSSVNSVLLDAYPMDPHQRLLVGGVVNQSVDGERLMVRQTTLMPNIHGLLALVALIFSPTVELRVDEDRTRWTGALCGLGCDASTHLSYDPENDMEVPFDVVFSYEDLETINKMRYWLNRAMQGNTDWKFSVKTDISVAQRKIKELMTQVLKKKRLSQGVEGGVRERFRWGQVEESLLLNPVESDEPLLCQTLYPLIWAVRLKQTSALNTNLSVDRCIRRLDAIALGEEQMRDTVVCDLCHVALEDLQAVKFHIDSSMHRDVLLHYNKPPPPSTA